MKEKRKERKKVKKTEKERGREGDRKSRATQSYLHLEIKSGKSFNWTKDEKLIDKLDFLIFSSNREVFYCSRS